MKIIYPQKEDSPEALKILNEPERDTHFKNPAEPLRELKRILSLGGVLILGYPSETKFFHLLHTALSRLTRQRKKIRAVFKDESSDHQNESFNILSDKKTVEKSIAAVGFQEKQTFSLLPLLGLYNIKILAK